MSFFNRASTTVNFDLIEEGDFFEGSINSKSQLQINGEIKGDDIKSEKLYIKSTGLVQNNIHSKFIILDGAVIGNIEHADRVIINRTGKLLGNINTKEMITAEGVMIQGAIKVCPNDATNLEQEIKKKIPKISHNGDKGSPKEEFKEDIKTTNNSGENSESFGSTPQK